MIPLCCKTIPRDTDSLLAGLNGGLASAFRLPNGNAVHLAGCFPHYDEVRIDLSQAEIDLSNASGSSLGRGQRTQGLTAERFSLVGRPIRRNRASIDLDLRGERVRFDFDHANDGSVVLVLAEAAGTLKLDVPLASLQSLLLEGVREVAAKQSIRVEHTELHLDQIGDRSLRAVVRVKASKQAGFFPVKGTVVVAGRLDVDRELVAKVSDLSCRGEGVVGSLITPLIQGKLCANNGRTVPLGALPLGDLTFHDLRVNVNTNDLQLAATYGAAAIQ